jgi:hypothetical protein
MSFVRELLNLEDERIGTVEAFCVYTCKKGSITV